MSMNASVLPSYTPSDSPPSYTSAPEDGEESLSYTQRLAGAHAHGTFTKKCGSVSVTLTEQENNAQMPVYAQRGVVSGTVHVDSCHHISEIVLKFRGRLRAGLTGSNAASRTIKTVNEKFVLWSFRNPLEGPCPYSIPFSVIFPASFKDGRREYPLPPSYEAYHNGIPGLSVNSEYSLKVVVKTSKTLWTHHKTVTVPLNYRPRKRPSQPIIPLNTTFFSSVKVCPEEWFQASAALKCNKCSDLTPLQTHFFLPSVRVFALSDCIPFHIQLTGRLSSLQALLSRLKIAGEDNSSSDSTGMELFQPRGTNVMTMSATVHRQVSVKVNNQLAWHNAVIGKGNIRAVPPSFDSSASSLDSCEVEMNSEQSLDWEGEIKLREGVQVGQFDAGNTSVKDFIIFSISGPSNCITDFVALRNAVPIAFVTDAWSEGNVYG
ncbi:hypothetical protein K435DRAFT_847745 [Dendrothele bispora CBS 962.96]|uniref:Arrestin-like N-terminal domain-containing protein n=1 Tax=Dendrothele bispora (strain CBS 962.96) TaxID=1314807 RepID=A0A4S8MYX7_DENBC|nr:hypothetical protein K435DRAFT_847745 [Dendrothele bispora CBS 962.96]